MRCVLVLVVAAVGSCAVAASAPAQDTGGARFVPGADLTARDFSVSPRSVAPGAPVRVAFRIDGDARRVRVRVDLVPEGGGPVADRLKWRGRTGKPITRRWMPDLAPGRYAARLRARPMHRRGRARAARALAVEAPAAPVSATSGVFPVQGPYTLGGDDARFGAVRTGHSHRGQDILAAEGVPVVAPRAGFVSWRAYQGGGAGHYLVVAGDDGRDYVFMHLQDGSIVVQKGQQVTAGQRLAAVGSTGRSSGPHLHFEIWPGGWYAGSAEPIDPLPDLQAWADP